MMDHILAMVVSYGIRYEKVDKKTIRVYGNFKGFSVIRECYDGWVELDGKLTDYEDFENWLYSIAL